MSNVPSHNTQGLRLGHPRPAAAWARGLSKLRPTRMPWRRAVRRLGVQLFHQPIFPQFRRALNFYFLCDGNSRLLDGRNGRLVDCGEEHLQLDARRWGAAIDEDMCILRAPIEIVLPSENSERRRVRWDHVLQVVNGVRP